MGEVLCRLELFTLSSCDQSLTFSFTNYFYAPTAPLPHPLFLSLFSHAVTCLLSVSCFQSRLVVKTALKLLIVFVEYTEANSPLLIQAVNTVDAKRGTSPKRQPHLIAFCNSHFLWLTSSQNCVPLMTHLMCITV